MLPRTIEELTNELAESQNTVTKMKLWIEKHVTEQTSRDKMIEAAEKTVEELSVKLSKSEQRVRKLESKLVDMVIGDEN